MRLCVRASMREVLCSCRVSYSYIAICNKNMMPLITPGLTFSQAEHAKRRENENRVKKRNYLTMTAMGRLFIRTYVTRRFFAMRHNRRRSQKVITSTTHRHTRTHTPTILSTDGRNGFYFTGSGQHSVECHRQHSALGIKHDVPTELQPFNKGVGEWTNRKCCCPLLLRLHVVSMR